MERPKRASRTFVWAFAILLGIVGLVGGYLIGYDEGVKDGYREGHAIGRMEEP